MSVNPVSSAASAISSAASKYISQTGASPQAGASSSLQEASETPAQTAKEAAKGDQVAKRLLVKEQQQQQLEDPTPAQEPGKGEVVDQHA